MKNYLRTWKIIVFSLIVIGICSCGVSKQIQVDSAAVGTLIIEAKQSIADAKDSGAEEFAPSDLMEAEKALGEAQRLLKEGATGKAQELAYRAGVLAKIALSTSREFEAKRRAEQIRNEIQQLKWESMVNEMAAAKAKQAIAEKVAYEAQIGSEEAGEMAERRIRRAELELEIAKVEMDIKLAEDFKASEYAEQSYNSAKSSIQQAKSAIENEDFSLAEQLIQKAMKDASQAFIQAKERFTKELEENLKKRDRAVSALAKAEASIEEARLLSTEKYSKDLYDQAERAFQQAKQAFERNQFDQSAALAEQARVSASSALAVAKSKELDEKARMEQEEIKANAADAVTKAEKALNEATNLGMEEQATDFYAKAKESLDRARQMMLDKDFEKAISNARDSMFNAELVIAIAKLKSDATKRQEEIMNSIVGELEKIPGLTVTRRDSGVSVSISSDIFTRTGIKDEEKDKIKSIAEVIKKYSNVMVIIEGHINKKGTERQNLQSSFEVAESFLNYLVDSEGLSRDRLAMVGYGSSKPLFLGSDSESKKRNNRIEILFLLDKSR